MKKESAKRKLMCYDLVTTCPAPLLIRYLSSLPKTVCRMSACCKDSESAHGIAQTCASRFGPNKALPNSPEAQPFAEVPKTIDEHALHQPKTSVCVCARNRGARRLATWAEQRFEWPEPALIHLARALAKTAIPRAQRMDQQFNS